jgi:hypothetical protein
MSLVKLENSRGKRSKRIAAIEGIVGRELLDESGIKWWNEWERRNKPAKPGRFGRSIIRTAPMRPRLLIGSVGLRRRIRASL